MKICTVAVFLCLIAAAYASCASRQAISVGGSISLAQSTSSVVTKLVSACDNPGVVVVGSQSYSPIVTARFIIITIEFTIQGSRILVCVDSMTGDVIRLPVYFDIRLGFFVAFIPLTGEVVYFVQTGCNQFIFYYVFLNSVDGTVYLFEVLNGNAYIAEVSCSGDVTLIAISSLPVEVIQLRRELVVEWVMIFGVQYLYVYQLTGELIYTYTLYIDSTAGTLMCSDGVVGLDFLVVRTECGDVSVDRVYRTIGGTFLIKSSDGSFMSVVRNSIYFNQYYTTVTAVSTMPYVRAAVNLEATFVEVSSGLTLQIRNVQTGIANTYSVCIGSNNMRTVTDALGNLLLVVQHGFSFFFYNIYLSNGLFYIVSSETRQVQLIDFSSGELVFYPADVTCLGSLTPYSLTVTYSLLKVGKTRYFVTTNVLTGEVIKTSLRLTNNLLILVDEMTQTTFVIIDTVTDMPTAHECWITKEGILIIDVETFTTVYISYENGQYIYRNVRTGLFEYIQADLDFVYMVDNVC